MSIIKSGQERALPAQLRQLKTGEGEKGLLLSHPFRNGNAAKSYVVP